MNHVISQCKHNITQNENRFRKTKTDSGLSHQKGGFFVAKLLQLYAKISALGNSCIHGILFHSGALSKCVFTQLTFQIDILGSLL